MASPKAEHVRAAGQTRDHTCHWPGCERQVPPAQWGCKPHWFQLPKELRAKIWATYVPGQEITMTPSEHYLMAAAAAERWIAANGKPPARDAFDDLATATGATREIVLELWNERAAIRQFLGNTTKGEAEARAMSDVKALLMPRRIQFTKGAHYVPDGDQYW